MTAQANIEFKRPDGASCPAYYAEPAAGDAAPAVVVIQEWWGLNEQIVGVGERFTKAGYRVLVPDLYRGERALDAAEAEHKMNALDFGDAATQDVTGAVQHLKQTGSKVGTVGFCMGGVLALLAPMTGAAADAAISWYGVPPAEAGDPGQLDIPVQCHFALQDTFFPPEQADALEDKLNAGNVENECYRYDAAHAFGNEKWDYYDADSASKAWERTMAFFERHLK